MTENLDQLRYPYGTELLFLATGAILSVVALVLLVRTWSAVKERSFILPVKEQTATQCYEVKKAHVVTQRSRYVKIVIAFVLSGVPAVWMTIESLEVYFATQRALLYVPVVGWFVSFAQFLIALTFMLSLVFAVRVYSTPSMFRKQIMFGTDRGNFVLAGTHRRTSTAPRREPQMRFPAQS